MKASDKELRVITGSDVRDAGPTSKRHLWIVAAAIGLAVLLVGGGRSLPQGEADRAHDTDAQPHEAAQGEPTAFVYFPSQYVNQATDVEPHIEAF